MAQLTLSRLAREDIAGITAYTEEKWSAFQASRYASALRAAMLEIAQGQVVLKRIKIGNDELERVLSGEHHIYVRRSSQQVFISRVLHSAMDVRLHAMPRMPKRLK